jgi:hypothetical protein
MALRNAFENLGLDSTLQAIRDRLPSALGGNGGVKVEQQGSLPSGTNVIGAVKIADSVGASEATVSAGGALKVDGSAATQPVSGTVTANQGGVWDIRNVSGTVALPTGAATSTKQSDGSQKTQVVDGSGNVISSTSNALDVNLKSGASGLALDATLTGGNQQTKITDGTNTANVISASTANSSANALAIAASSQTQAFSITSVTAGTTYDVGNYSSVKVQILTQYTGTTPTISWQTSNDGTNWVSQVLEQANSANTTAVTLTTGTGLFYGTLTGRYFRLNFTGAYTSGTATGTIVFSTLPVTMLSMGVTAAPVGATSASGTITTSASSVSSLSASNLGDMVLITVHGTYAGVSFGITMSDDGGTTFYPVSVYDTSAQAWLPPNATITPGTNASKQYWVSVSPIGNVIKVQASAYTSGTANIRINQGYTAGAPSAMSQIMDAAGNNRGVNVTAANSLQVDGSAVTQPVGGDTASGAADAGNPVKVGGLAKTALPTPVSDGQRVNGLWTKTGKLVAVGSLREMVGNQQTTIVSSTSETTIITADATYFLDLYGLVLTNTSASATKVTIKDATAGTTRFTFQVPATETRGFMLPVDSGHKQATANNNWTATCGTSVANMEITALYVKHL